MTLPTIRRVLMNDVRWTAPILSFPYVLFHLLPFDAERLSPARSRTEVVILAPWGLILRGMMLAFAWERFGGGLVLVGFLVQVDVNPTILGLWPMWVAPGIGVIFVCGMIESGRRSQTDAAA
jgi:hypothetical protein